MRRAGDDDDEEDAPDAAATSYILSACAVEKHTAGENLLRAPGEIRIHYCRSHLFTPYFSVWKQIICKLNFICVLRQPALEKMPCSANFSHLRCNQTLYIYAARCARPEQLHTNLFINILQSGLIKLRSPRKCRMLKTNLQLTHTHPNYFITFNITNLLLSACLEPQSERERLTLPLPRSPKFEISALAVAGWFASP